MTAVHWNILQIVSVSVLPKASFKMPNISGVQILLSHSLPPQPSLLPRLIFLTLLVFFCPQMFPSPSLPSSASLHLICRCKKRCLSVSGTHCWLIEISDWEADIQAERQIVGETWPLECFADILSPSPSHSYSFFDSFYVSQPGLPIADMREVSRKSIRLCSHNPPPPLQSYSILGINLSRVCLLTSIPLPTSHLSSSLHSSCFFFFPRPLSHHAHSWDVVYTTTVNTSRDPVCLAKCFLAAGWKACSIDSKSGAICYLIGWHGKLSVDFSYRGEQGDNGTVSATSGAAGARRR